jgi:HK97 gp10 family phage protein
MSDIVTIEVRGLQQLSRAMLNLPNQLSTRIMREALHAAGEVMALAAEGSAPVRTGELKASIMVKVHVDNELRNNSVRVGPGYDRGSLLVHGARPNRHKPGGQEAIVDSTESPGVYGKFVELGHRVGHRGGAEIEFGSGTVPAHPWLRPAFESSNREALEVFVNFMRAGVETVVRELSEG